jgi:lysophospholipase
MSEPDAKPAGAPADLLASYRPANRYGFLEGAGGRLRYACWNASGTGNPRGTILLLAGRGEFIEKYATEIVGELLGRGFAVIALDWRGQGLSDRPLADHEKGHINNFTTYMADLRLLIEQVVMPQAVRPVLALCHSMGGHILLRHLAEHGADPLSAALIVSPMTALQREAFPRRSSSATCSAPVRSSSSPANSPPITSPTTSSATDGPRPGSRPTRACRSADRPSAGRARPCAR